MLPEVVLRVIRVDLGAGRRAGRRAWHAGAVQDALEVAAAAVGVARGFPLRSRIDRELDGRLGPQESVRGNRDPVTVERLAYPLPVREQQDTAGVQEERVDRGVQAMRGWMVQAPAPAYSLRLPSRRSNKSTTSSFGAAGTFQRLRDRRVFVARVGDTLGGCLACHSVDLQTLAQPEFRRVRSWIVHVWRTARKGAPRHQRNF